MNRAIPITVKSDSDEYWYILIEKDYQLTKRLDKWYAEATASGVLTRATMIGDLKVESWKKIDEAEFRVDRPLLKP